MDIKGNENIIIQNIKDSTITLNVNGHIQEIRNELAELKKLLQEAKVQTIQYADKIYNIEHIDEANFGFVTGKKAFNEHLTKNLLEAMAPYSYPVNDWLNKATASNPNWESEARISDKAKEIIAFSWVGVLGTQLSKLMAIGKEDFSDSKQRKYIEKCLDISKWTLDLICYALLSQLWDEIQSDKKPNIGAAENNIRLLLTTNFELSMQERLTLCSSLVNLFEAANISPFMEELPIAFNGKAYYNHTCSEFQRLQSVLDKSQYSLLDCFEAEKNLADFLCPLAFLIQYKMASIKQIGYQQVRLTVPGYLHRYTALGIDTKANVDAEKVNFTDSTTHTDAVLLYKGDSYQQNLNLMPFVMDYNALTFERGARIAFYRAKDDINKGLEYVFLDDGSTRKVEFKKMDNSLSLNEIMADEEKRKDKNINDLMLLLEAFEKATLNKDDLGFDGFENQ